MATRPCVSKVQQPKFTELNNLSAAENGAAVLFATDDWFAAAENLLKVKITVLCSLNLNSVFKGFSPNCHFCFRNQMLNGKKAFLTTTANGWTGGRLEENESLAMTGQ